MTSKSEATSLEDLIASRREDLTPTERRIAQEVLRNPTLVAFGTVSDLAAHMQISRPSVVRFAVKLGFGGFPGLRNRIREGMAARLSRPSDRIRREPGAAADHAAIERSVHAALETLTVERLANLALPIARAGSVWLLSGETSMSGAHVLHAGLSMLRPNVHLVMEQSTGRDLCGAGPGDVGVVLDFARYRRHTVTAARVLVDYGVDLIAITDSPLSPIASLASARCELSIPGIGPFDSAVPVIVACELVVAQVARELGDDARRRIDRLEALWQTIGAYVGEPVPEPAERENGR